MLIWRNIDLRLLAALLVTAAQARREPISKPPHPAVQPAGQSRTRGDNEAFQLRGKKTTCHVRTLF